MNMKTAISLPDHLYNDAEKTAKSLGIPRSQLFAKALEEYISKYKRGEVTEKLNEIYGKMETGTGVNIADIEPASVESLRELTKNDAW